MLRSMLLVSYQRRLTYEMSAYTGHYHESANESLKDHLLADPDLKQALVAMPKQKAVVVSKAYGKGKVVSRKQDSTGRLTFPPSRCPSLFAFLQRRMV